MGTSIEPRLEFLPNDAGEEEGLGHAGIETFRDAPYASLGREHGQNSLDAREADPVTVTIDLIRIPTSDYPGYEALRTTVQACLNQARNDKAKRFFTVAKKTLEADALKVLRIADSNTRGLRGPPVPGKPFHALVKGAGVSEDKAETSGGSFGIGKNAAFAVSDLQTVFYSTLYQEDDGNKKFLAQGKSVLVSHHDGDGTAHRSTGYWGLHGFNPVSDPVSVPSWLRRSEIGTSVFAIGFREKENWAPRVAAALLQNFFGAIHRGRLEFLIADGQIRINKSTIGLLFEDERIRHGAEQEARLDDLDFARALYRCLISDRAEERLLDTPGLGRTTVRVLMEDELPKRVLLLRNGMWITDSLQHFGEKLLRFPMYRDFVAVVECHENAGNALLKQLESPRHDSLSAERIHDPVSRVQAEATMKSLAKQIREAIRECAKPEPVEKVAIDELAEFFADTSPNDRPPAPGADTNPEKLTYKVTPPRKTSRTESAGGTKGHAGGAGDGEGKNAGGAGSAGDSNGGGSGGTGERGGSAISLLEPRNTLGSGRDRRERIIHFTPETSGTADLRILASGIESSAVLKVIKSDKGQLQSGAVRLPLEEGKRTKVSITFDEPYDGPIELAATTQAQESAP